MFDNSSLYALSKTRSGADVYKINVSAKAIMKIRENFAEGLDFFLKQEPHDFTPLYKLDEDECSCLKNFTAPDFLFDAIRNSANLKEITGKDFERLDIKALFMGEVAEQDNDEKYTIVFKRLYMSNVLKRSGLNLLWSDNVYTSIESDALSIPENSNAAFANGSLYFLSYKIVNEMLDLSDRYRSATSADLREFESKVACDGDLTDFANTKARKLIAMINDSRVLEIYSIEEIAAAAKRQNIMLKYDDDGKIALDLGKHKEAMIILDFLAENTFISTFTKTRNRTNSREAF